VSVERQDKILTCKDCGEEFIFTVREQDFYIQKGFENDPARCGPCRNARKRDRNSNTMSSGNSYGNSVGYSGGGYGNSASGNYNGGGGYSNRSQGNGGRPGGYGSPGGYSRPSNGNYGNSNGNSMGGNYGNSNYRSSSVYGSSGPSRSNMGNFGDQERKMYAITCANCGVQTEVPFAPRQGVPVFCRTCYNSQKGR
jgi:CxxC-x17-CxxC domain-containing protein